MAFFEFTFGFEHARESTNPDQMSILPVVCAKTNRVESLHFVYIIVYFAIVIQNFVSKSIISGRFLFLFLDLLDFVK